MRPRSPLVIGCLAAAFIVGLCGLKRVRAQTGDGSLDGLRERLQARREAADKKAEGAESAQLGGRRVSIWEPPPGGAARAPLVLFSHGFHGSSTQSTFLMRALADAGYLVVAPTHADALNAPGGIGLKAEVSFARPAEWTGATYQSRSEDVKAVLKALKDDDKWSGKIDWDRVALAGHSLGGYTVLGLAGAWPEWKTPGIKAVLALSPFCSPFAEKHTLGKLDVPVMYQGGTLDFGITPSVKNPGGVYEQTPSPAYFIEFSGAGHFAWTDLNPRFQKDVIEYSRAFLDRYVKGDRSADVARRLPDTADVRAK